MKQTTLIGIVVLVLAVAGLGLYMSFVPPPVISEPGIVGEESPRASTPVEPAQSQTIVGFWECLPHKNTSGPQTMECAFGIAVDQSDGHYAIDTSLMSTYPVDFPTGTKVRVTGIVTPANQLSSVQKYGG